MQYKAKFFKLLVVKKKYTFFSDNFVFKLLSIILITFHFISRSKLVHIFV